MNTKHTPGPWVIRTAPYAGWDFKGGFLGTIESTGGETIYAGPSSFHALKGSSQKQALANAKLIAAAPDLLEALQAIEQGFTDGSIKFTKKRVSDSDPYHKANTLMCKAIEKATS